MKMIALHMAKGVSLLVQLLVSIILYFVMFFGIGFIVNMLIRKTWLMAYLYPFILIIMIDNLATWDYLVRPGQAFSALGTKLLNLTSYDIILFVFGFLGTITAGYVMKLLRRNGYQMF
jgi:hypothetical protein